MKRGLSLICTLLILGALVACKEKATAPEAAKESKAPSGLEEVHPGENITGDALTEEYIKVLCNKYESCDIKAFQNRTDCQNRIREVLTQDSKWEELHLDKGALKKCLAEFADFPCQDFMTGKAPQSCQKL